MTVPARATADPGRKPWRILLVEDNPSDVHLLKLSLTQRGIPFELTCFSDGEQAIEAIGGENFPLPDLILIDLNLPVRDGFAVLQVVRAKPAFVGLPVGILTSSKAAADRLRVALIGAEQFIHKPLSLEAFLAQVGQAVETLLGGSQTAEK